VVASVLIQATAVGPVYCIGHQADGRRCPNPTPIAERLTDGRVVVRHDGREHDVTGRSTTCPRCKTRTGFDRIA
jgi:hypothetical protein